MDMESLIDSLDTAKWEEVPCANKPDGFVEYHVNPHAHRQKDPTTVSFMVESDDAAAPFEVMLMNCKKDPIKKVNIIEFRLNGTEITGIDLDGDIVVQKS